MHGMRSLEQNQIAILHIFFQRTGGLFCGVKGFHMRYAMISCPIGNTAPQRTYGNYCVHMHVPSFSAGFIVISFFIISQFQHVAEHKNSALRERKAISIDSGFAL